MDEFYGKDDYEIYQMPKALKISSEGFSEFEKAYNFITEGATDWKYMKAAYENLADTHAEYKDMDFEFLEYEPENSNKNGRIKLKMGNDSLKTMCERCSKWKHARKLIFIADADDEKINNELGEKMLPIIKIGTIMSFLLFFRYLSIETIHR